MSKRMQETFRAKVVRVGDWKEAQRRSFAYGNANLSNPDVTREIVEEEANKSGTYHQLSPCGDVWIKWHCVHCERYFHRKPYAATCRPTTKVKT